MPSTARARRVVPSLCSRRGMGVKATSAHARSCRCSETPPARLARRPSELVRFDVLPIHLECCTIVTHVNRPRAPRGAASSATWRRRRTSADAVKTLGDPAVTGVDDVVAEHPQRVLVVPRRGHRNRPITRPQGVEERLHPGWLPLPGVLIGELREPSQEIEPGDHRRSLQKARTLLWPNHRASPRTRPRGVEMRHAGGKDGIRGPGQPVHDVASKPTLSDLATLQAYKPRVVQAPLSNKLIRKPSTATARQRTT